MKPLHAMLALALVLSAAPAFAAPKRPAAKVPDPGAAIILSGMFPGLGESYNSGWKLGFPWAECLIGTVCPFFRVTSMIDAASGVDKDNLRFDFWSLPE